MTIDDFLKRQGQQPKQRKKPDDEEHRIQVDCVRWFRLQYPEYADILFAIPNGGRRDAITGAKLKDEGVIAGVSDLIFLKANRFYGSLCIEMKKPGGRQSESQKTFEEAVRAFKGKYVICYSLEEFQAVVADYLEK